MEINTNTKILALFNDKEISQLRSVLERSKDVTYCNSMQFSSHDDKTLYDMIFHSTTSQFEGINEVLQKLYAYLKPGGTIIYHCQSTDNVKTLEFNLKSNGFTDVSIEQSNQETTDNAIYLKSVKPKYDIGSFRKLNLSSLKTNNKSNGESVSNTVWKLDDDDETINPDDLLDEDDFKKPDQADLRVCGTTGQRKACKDCSCGLADELDAEAAKKKPVNSAEAKSSCGSCYLGDAFRCAECPYLGMPAFKPGEKVQLSEGFLKADV